MIYVCEVACNACPSHSHSHIFVVAAHANNSQLINLLCVLTMNPLMLVLLLSLSSLLSNAVDLAKCCRQFEVDSVDSLAALIFP